MPIKLLFIIISLFLFRLVYGLCSEFWYEDELQVYLIGLKSFTTNTWPYYGPDLVYTNTQIPGALQGLLVAIPFHILKLPESPALFLNLLSFLSLSLLAWYITKRIEMIPSWLVWTIVMTTPWAMHYSTRVVNPSYALVFAIPFFIGLLELLPLYKKALFPSQIAFFILGCCTTCIMQLHLSWVLLIPLAGVTFLSRIKSNFKQQAINASLYLLGVFVGALTLIPTLFLEDTKSVASNIQFNADNWSNLPIIVLRFFSFASNEIPYALGGSTAQRLAVIYEQIWMSPIAAFLLILGFAQVAIFILFLFNKHVSQEFRTIKLLVICSILLLYGSFFFSVKGPSSHTFYIMFPLALYYAFYCYQWLIMKHKYILPLLKSMAILGLLFHVGLGAYHYKHKSIYKDRAKVQEALEKMDYTILGRRRADDWGYGY